MSKYIYRTLQAHLGANMSSRENDTDDDTEHLLVGKETYQSPPRNKSSRLWFSMMAQIVLLALSASFFIAGIFDKKMTDRECTAQTSAYSPAFDAVEYETVRFQGALLDRNPYKGQPSPELDAAWDDIVNMGQVKVHPKDMKLLQKPSTQAKASVEGGDWYMGGLEVFHQLHCVRLIRQYTYYDHYSRPENRPVAFTDSNHTLRLHVDHCIDMLRQVVQCHGDVGIVTSSWVDSFPDPYPDFSVWHKCRRFEPLNEYTAKHRLDVELHKSQGDRSLPKPPCENAAPDEICP